RAAHPPPVPVLLARPRGPFPVEVEEDDPAALRGEGEAILPAEAPRPAGDQRHLVFQSEVHTLARSAPPHSMFPRLASGCGSPYFPLNSGARFWKKACSPSPASSVRMTFSKARTST